MRNTKLIALWALLVIATMACGLTSGVSNLVGGGKNSGTVTQLWSDIPPMDGLEKANLDLPLPARLAIQGLVKSGSKGEGNLDFISFTTTKSASDIASFYTMDKMTAAGWTLQDQSGCQDISSDTSSTAGICFFGKENQSDHTGSYLVIFITQDSKTKQTQVFFLRIDAKNLPTQTP